MKYMCIVSIAPENSQAIFKRVKETAALTEMEGLTALGRWTALGTGRSFHLLETDDPVALKKFCNYWRDIMEIEVVPVIDAEENWKALGIS